MVLTDTAPSRPPSSSPLLSLVSSRPPSSKTACTAVPQTRGVHTPAQCQPALADPPSFEEADMARQIARLYCQGRGTGVVGAGGPAVELSGQQ